jgi:HlyD family secretion protein
VYVKEGDMVGVGKTLVDLNSASLQASVEQANAALASAQAKLDALQTGATPQDIAVSQTALASAEQTLANSYVSVPNTISGAYANANDAIRNQLAAFFTNAETGNPQLTFPVSDSGIVNSISSERLQATTELNTWQTQNGALVGASPAQLDAALQAALGHLTVAKTLLTTALNAVVNATNNLTATTATTYKTDVTTGTSEVNSSIGSVNTLIQTIASEESAVAQAQAGLNLTTASSTAQEIEGQQAAVAGSRAALSSAQVALNNASLNAPFPGTVQNLTAQIGQVVSPGAPVLSLVNNGGLKIETYVSEADVAKIKEGDAAQITLDAFGTGTTFPATITTVDSAETQVNGVPLYLVTLHFTDAEPQVKDGMTGNVHIVLAEDDNVLVVPSGLVLNEGNQYYVLAKTTAGTEQKQVQIGLVGANGTTEITSGVNAGDTLVNF